ncbi:DnaB-like helicase N-terminal domain-containing protein [Intrasporangium flavum]|uniref:DnaB-like helicase N-terminal domain-containing protein n=1 Tax=Intrasporangium flavum TaxID=1428657 RepID=UPI00096E2551|nr:DnaB-like helicase N-terminal domain-containing protein [Intrasporangium flavum]
MTDRPRDRHLTVAPPPDDQPGWQPPQDREAEQATLGAAMTNPRALDDISLVTAPGDFHDLRHELIYDAILNLYARTRPVDKITVANQLGRDLDRAGGRAYLEHLTTLGIGVIDGSWHAQIVAEHAALRRLQQHHLKGLADIDNRGDTPAADLYARCTDHLEQIPRGVPGVDHVATSSWAPVDLADILRNGEVLEQPTELARNDGQCLLYPSAIHSISGEPESGKTWVALIAAAQSLRNGEHVTYVDFEDRAGRVVPRLVHLGAPAEAIVELFHYIRPSQALDHAGRKLLDQYAATSSLAVIDGVTEAMTMHGLSLLDNEDAARYLDLLPRHLADHGPAVLQIDHVVKDSEKQGRWAIGAGHKLAGLDGAAYGVKVLEPFGRGKIGRAAIAVHKDRPGAVREIALGNAVAHLVIDSRDGTMAAWLEEPSTMPKSADGGMRPTHLMEKVSRYVEMTPGASRRQIEDGVQGKREYVRLAIDALVREGFLTTTAGPRGTHNHSLIATFREDEDDAR